MLKRYPLLSSCFLVGGAVALFFWTRPEAVSAPTPPASMPWSAWGRAPAGCAHSHRRRQRMLITPGAALMATHTAHQPSADASFAAPLRSHPGWLRFGLCGW